MSITAAEGFVAAGAHCGVKRLRPDLALIATDDGRPVPCAAVFTTNRFAAASVLTSRDRLRSNGGQAAVIVINSGNANAGTGADGRIDAEAMCVSAARAVGAHPNHGLVCSTGVIGRALPMDRILTGIETLAPTLSRDGADDAARAILTTDLKPKQVVIEADGFTLGGMAKGSGMLAPNMATMLGFLTTDASASPEMLREVLNAVVNDTFNALSLDGATSTNDTVALMASGRRGPVSRSALEAAVRRACEDLTLQMARDAEGRTKVVKVLVCGAADDAQARRAARAIAENQLVKCSWRGEAPLWGRILAEAGSCGVDFSPERSSVAFGGVRVSEHGVEADHDAHTVRAHMAEDEIEVTIDLGLGTGRGRMVTVDLGPEYIAENSSIL
jgi:glutamate N-acetyltransferase/amino-acid N-acetyltransferase